MDTRAILIEAAQRLFATRGYDRTTVTSIIAEAGVSKGAFYHYFSSKEDILDAVTEDIARDRIADLLPIIEDETTWAVDKINRYMVLVRDWRLRNLPMLLEIAKATHRDENAIIAQKMKARLLDMATPVLARIIEQGQREELFSVQDATESASLLLHFSNSVGEAVTRSYMELAPTEENVELMYRRTDIFVEAFERILGAPERSIERVPRDVIRHVLKAAHAEGPSAAEETAE